MKKMQLGDEYKIFGVGTLKNQYMDNLVSSVNEYIDALHYIEEEERKLKVFSNRKPKTNEELKDEYNKLVRDKYIQTQTFDNYLVNERNKELEYRSVIIHFPEALLQYEKIATEKINFLKERKKNYMQLEQSFLNSKALGQPIMPTDSKGQLQKGETLDLERAKLRYAIQQIDKYIKEMESDLESKKLENNDVAAKIDLEIKTTDTKENPKIELNSVREQEKIEEDITPKAIVMSEDEKVEIKPQKKEFAVTKDVDYNNYEYELDEEATMQNYRNSGYGINYLGWYFNPSVDEYMKDYNPLEDSFFQVFKKTKQKESKNVYISPKLRIEDYNDYTTDYNQQLARYHEKLDNYIKDCKIISKLYEKVLIGEAEEFELKEMKSQMEQKYLNIEEKYNVIVSYREKVLEEMKKGNLWHSSLSKDQINELKKMGVVKPEGKIYNEYLIIHGLTIEYIDEPKEPVDFKLFLAKLEEKYNYKSNDIVFYDIDRIVGKVRGDYDASSYKELAYKLNNIKIFNHHKFKERTIIDIPMRLVRGVIGTSAKGIGKLFGKIAYAVSPNLKEETQQMINRVNELSDGEIDYIDECFNNGNMMSEYKKALPNSIWNLILQKILEKRYKAHDKGNFDIQLMHENLINLHTEMTIISEKLNDGNLSEEEIKELNFVYQRDNELVINIIMNMEKVKADVGKLVNPTGGAKGFEENWKAAINQITGGKKNKMKDNLDYIKFGQKTGDKIEEAIKNNDGLTAADLYIYREKVKIDHDVKKRTFKNLGGYVQVGEREWKPFSEEVDYVEHHPVQDFLRTAAIALSVYNVINQIQLRNAVAELQKECQNRANFIQGLQQQNQYLINQVKTIQAKYHVDPVKFEQEYYNFCQQTVGYGSQTVEVIAQKSAAGAAGTNQPILDVSNNDYSSIDSIGHAQSSYIKELENIHSNTNLSEMQKIAEFDKVMQNYSNEMTNVALSAEQNLIKFMSLSSFDHTTLNEVINQAGNVDPKLATDLYRELKAIITDINNIDLTNKVNVVLNNVRAEADLWPAIATCASIIGSSTIDEYYASKRRKVDSNNFNKKKSSFWKNFKDVILDIQEKTEIDKITDELREKYKSKDIKAYNEGSEKYDRELEEWNSKGAFYRFTHKKEKPNELKVHLEMLEGRSK